jgi:UDP-galactopyranose mutase
VEEPIIEKRHSNTLEIFQVSDNLWTVVPRLCDDLTHEEVIESQKLLLNNLFKEKKIEKYFFWYYTPLSLPISNHFEPEVIVYDCMDELSSFNFAAPELKEREFELFKKADIVFTGGHTLYEYKKSFHHNIHPFPSSIDKAHFSKARIQSDPDDQKEIPYPRFGFYGVVDERFDLELIKEVSIKKPEWHFIIIGPVVKIDPDSLPRLPNIHYLGSKSYNELPNYLGGWDIATIPFLRNKSTKYISPTKTPEYLAGGKPVISTSISDVINPYGQNKLVHIADTAHDFIMMAEKELDKTDKSEWINSVDNFLADNSWDNTWLNMSNLVYQQLVPVIPIDQNTGDPKVLNLHNKRAYV